MPSVTTAQLNAINLLIEEGWADSQQMIDSSALDSTTVDKMYTAQKGMLGSAMRVIEDPNKDYDLKIWWIDFCNESATDGGTDPCDTIDAAQAGVDSKPYKIESSIEDKFSMDEADFFGSFLDKGKFVAQNLNQKITNMVNRLNIKALAFLHGNAGLNKGGVYTANGSGQYEVDSAEFASTNVVTKMLFDAQMSRVLSPFIVDGKNLWSTVLNARLNSPNGEGKGDAARAMLFGNVVNDPQGFAKVSDVGDSTFLVSPAAYHLAFKNYIPNSVPEYDAAADKWKYSIELGRYGARIDVFMQRVCINATKNHYKFVWLLKLHYDFFANPYGCPDPNNSNEKVTGIIEYTSTVEE
jgi:hypothetical protein